jgi:23S rRNA (cytidine1920-2'-O)/16S rRNA (cytidine1409-2'-O)-methyltransferase
VTGPTKPGTARRLDALLVQRGLARTRAQAQALILSGRVLAGGVPSSKPGTRFPEDVRLEVVHRTHYVSRGGPKLAGALERLGLPVAGRDVVDVGASTGGFTQVLLEHGARRVIAVDVGRGQLDWGLRRRPEVHVVEGVNARYLRPERLPFVPSLAVVDVSFISLEKVLPAVMACLDADGDCVALVKPQFEVGRGEVGRGGVVRDARQHERVLRGIAGFATARDWAVLGFTASHPPGAEGNREFFVHLKPRGTGLGAAALERAILDAVDAGPAGQAR